MFTREKLRKSPKTKKENLDYGYLVCKKCNGYYKLQEGESPADFEFCQCGGDLKYVKDIDAYLNEKKPDKLEKKVKKQNDELLKTKKELENEISERKQLKENFERKLEGLEKQLTEKSDELLEAKKELENVISDNKQSKENFEKKLNELEKQLTEKSNELLKTKEALEIEISELKQLKENLEKKFSELEKQLEKKSNELLKTKEALEIEISERKREEKLQKKRDRIIEIKNLKKSYDNGKIKALNGIDLEIKKGEFVSIIGPSASGKSTLLNMIGALDKADEGSINVAGIDLMQNKDLSKFRSQEIGFVFQLHNLIPNLTVLENVQIPMFETKSSGKEMQDRALKLLDAVELADRIKQTPTKLSGGERQRVAIARALVNHPSIILADEPTGALDSKTGDIILKLLHNIHKKENVTVVMVTHEPYVAEMADRIVNMLDGKIKEN